MPAPFQPIVLGGDIGGYSLSRAFWEGYRKRSVLISAFPTGAVRHSRFIDNLVEPRMDNPEVLRQVLSRLTRRFPGQKLLVVGSADWHVEALIALKLDSRFVVPYAPAEVLRRATDKAEFSRACKKLGITHPQTQIVEVNGNTRFEPSDLGWPVIGKAGSTAGFHLIDYPGKMKVYEFHSPQEISQTLQQLDTAGYRGTFILQRKILGNDSQMRILTCHCDTDSQVDIAVYGRVLLEEHTPGALGNPAGIITEPNDQVVSQAARLLHEFSWTGYANFDIKVDPRDGKAYFFELNPRLGRSNYYVTMTGINPVRKYVEDYLGDNSALTGKDTAGSSAQELRPVYSRYPQKLYTVLPLRLLRRYVNDPETLKQFRRLVKSRLTVNPLWSAAEHDPRRLAYICANQLNQYRKFARYYPVAKHQSLEFHHE